ncbi:atherin-like [Cebus imitator]|uniref:atherin-like n=1 Tax=Cebus imitator TaxID=2715852 RepID=UPI000809F832|nr:atherin-like [Cebus imitator]
MAFIFHALTIGRPQFRRPGQGQAVAEVRGACCLAHADRRAPRAACSTLWAAVPQRSPNTQQTSRSFLQTQHPVARLAPGHSPGARSALSAAKVHTQSTLPVLSRPARTPLLATPPSGPHAGCGPAQDFEPRPLHDPHKALSPGIPTRSPQSLLPPPPSPVLGKCSISEPELGGGLVPGPTEATADLPG